MSGIQSRQNINDYDYDDRHTSWWYDTREGLIAKWAIFFGLLFLFLAFIIGGRWHAMKRINKGLAPLAYHRWLLSRRQRAMYDPAYREPHVYYSTYPPHNGQYGMYPMPPPMYDANAVPPPTYQPPGGHKIDPSQARSGQNEASPAYEPPPGPPPIVHASNTGASNNPFRA